MSNKAGVGTLGVVEVAHATLKGGTVANAANIDASFWSAAANAHAVLGKFRWLQLNKHCSAAIATAASSDPSSRPTTANTHAGLAGVAH